MGGAAAMGAIVDKPNPAVKSYSHAYNSGHISTSQEAQNGFVALICLSHLRPPTVTCWGRAGRTRPPTGELPMNTPLNTPRR